MSKNLLFWNPEDTPSELHSILETLADEYPISSRDGELLLSFNKNRDAGRSAVKFEGEKVNIVYGSPTAAARALGNALAGLSSDENNVFKTCGIMLDCSRNAVMKVSHFKSWLRRLALLGYNMAMLYTEDTYQLPDEPFFGYKRSPYTLSDIQEIDAYAKALGIEMIACIQTLGHLEQILQWNAYKKVKDTSSVLLVDTDETYTLIDKMLAFWDEALSSRRIHIGMDEAHDLGRGRFMDIYGYERGFDIFNRHFAKVEKLCEKYSFKPMIWSDMYFRMSNPQQAYYDRESQIPEDVIEMIPKNSELVYWDYYHYDKEFYLDFIAKHRKLGSEPLMASAAWTWKNLWCDHEHDVKTVKPCLEACREAGLQEVFFTIWGGYCEIDSALAALCWSADLVYGGTEDAARLEAQFRAITGASYEKQMIAARLSSHILKNGEENETVGAPFLLWDDPLLGICWDSKKGIDPEFPEKAIKLFSSICEELAAYRDEDTAGNIDHAWLCADVLRRKVEFRRDLLAAYENNDKSVLRKLADEAIPGMLESTEQLSASFRRMWHKYFKPCGLEIIQIRQGGQLQRLKEAQTRINDYIAGTLDSLPELENRIECGATNDRFYCLVASGSNNNYL